MIEEEECEAPMHIGLHSYASSYSLPNYKQHPLKLPCLCLHPPHCQQLLHGLMRYIIARIVDCNSYCMMLISVCTGFIFKKNMRLMGSMRLIERTKTR